MDESNSYFRSFLVAFDGPPFWLADLLSLLVIPLFFYGFARVSYKAGLRADFTSWLETRVRRITPKQVALFYAPYVMLILISREYENRLKYALLLSEFVVCVPLSFWCMLLSYTTAEREAAQVHASDDEGVEELE